MPISKMQSDSLGTGSNTDAIDLPSGTTAQRPSSPVEGMTRYNTDEDKMEVYADGEWTLVTAGANYNVEYLVVAGGGAGGYAGGGAGGLRSATGFGLIFGTSYTVTVGAGASTKGGDNSGNSGSDSVFSTITSIGGGGGAVSYTHLTLPTNVAV